MENRRNYTLEFWRFFFSLIICAFHFESIFEKWTVAEAGFMGVEFFFMLSGYLIAQSYARREAVLSCPMSAKEALNISVKYVANKIKLILPTLFVILILFVFVFAQGSLLEKVRHAMNMEWDFLMLSGTSFGWNAGNLFMPTAWFLTAILAVGYVVTFFMNWKPDVLKFLAPVAALLLYSYFGSNTDRLLEHELSFGFLDTGFIRAFAGMGLGVTAHMLCAAASGKKFGKIKLILLNVLELYVVCRLVYLLFTQTLGMDNFRLIAYMLVLVLLSFMNVTVLSKLLNNPVSRFLGSVSLTIYLLHWSLIEQYYKLIRNPKIMFKLYRLRGLAPFKGYGNPLLDVILYTLTVVACAVVLSLAMKYGRRLAALLREKYRARTAK
ncbi:MAG: acyltransferase family protein [Oscillospiraceae bacterium]|jgi:peptidoglycan/LPS O-acetylase OafA/YrhL|nr:acyltransferase family protein [Oscillospiraceae bacterium]